MKIKLAGVVKESIVDGPGIRLTVFVQGCGHNCLGCQNPQTHNPSKGYWGETDEIIELLAKRKALKGITLSGGEPLDQPEPILILAKAAKQLAKDVIIYSGYIWEDILIMAGKNKVIAELLKQTWLLIDGPFVENQKDLSLKFKGSANQRVVDVKKSLETQRVIEHIF